MVKNQIQRHRQIIIKKATSKLNKGRATNNNYSDILKKFWMMYWPKLVILMGIIILIVILNAIFNNVNKNDRMNDNNDTDAQKYTTTMKNANNTVKSVVTVENETSKDSSLPKDKASQDEVGSGVVYKNLEIRYTLLRMHTLSVIKKIKK